MLGIGLKVRAPFDADVRADTVAFPNDRCLSTRADQIFHHYVFTREIRSPLQAALRAARRNCVLRPWRRIALNRRAARDRRTLCRGHRLR
jgi:hypothetical protein